MAKMHDFTKPCKITITNVMDPNDPALVNKDALTGERRVISLAEAKAAGFNDFEYLLDKDGNFVIDPESGASVGTPVVSDDVMVIVRQSVKSTDRYIQFFATQQKILLAAGDSITFESAIPAAIAHYQALAVEGEIEVSVVGASSKEAATEADINAAIADPEIKNVVLTQDVAMTGNLQITAADKAIDGNGHKVTATVDGTGADKSKKDGILNSSQKGVTIANMTVDVTGVADKKTWAGNYGIQCFEGETTISDVKVTNANVGILVNGGKATMTGTIDVSGNGFGGVEVSKGTGGVATVPSLDASKATFVNSTEAYGEPTLYIDGYSEIGDVIKAPAGMTKVVYTEDLEGNPKDQLHFYLNAANAVKPVVDGE